MTAYIDISEITKPYYRIGEVAKMLGESTATLRFWQKEFSVRDERSKKGQRVFSRTTVAKLFAIRHLLREWKFTIPGAKQRLASANLTIAK